MWSFFSKRIFFIKNIFSPLRLGIVLLIWSALNNSQLVAQTKPARRATAAYIYKIIENPIHTYGYDVYVSGKLIIHQPTIPALAGNNGFATRRAAEAVARLVIRKIQKGEMPPKVTEEEMPKLAAVPQRQRITHF
jgi:hypothetical protein